MSSHAQSRLPADRRRRAFTLVEVCVATLILVVALSGMVGALLTSSSLGRVNEETARAQRAATRIVEQLQGVPFAEAFATFNASTADDAGLVVAALGPNFAVDGLNVSANDADGMCGEIVFPTIDVAGVAELREDVVDDSLGMPRDLDRDGAVDADDHAADYRILPVRVRVRWTGVSGERTLDIETVLCAR